MIDIPTWIAVTLFYSITGGFALVGWFKQWLIVCLMSIVIFVSGLLVNIAMLLDQNVRFT